MRHAVALTVALCVLALPPEPLAKGLRPAPTPAPTPAPSLQPLYFAVELKQDGRIVGRPKLLGVLGKRVALEKRRVGSEGFDYRLELFAHAGDGGRYALSLDVELPDRSFRSELQLLHGEVRRVGGPRGEPGKGFEVELLVLKVDSPEFRALMDLTAATGSARTSI